MKKYKYNLTEEQNIAIDKIFPDWTMTRDHEGHIVIYPNLDLEDIGDDLAHPVVCPLTLVQQARLGKALDAVDAYHRDGDNYVRS